jgi:hypothetical protein
LEAAIASADAMSYQRSGPAIGPSPTIRGPTVRTKRHRSTRHRAAKKRLRH